MVKKVMFDLMVFLTSMRFVALAYTITVEPNRLPVAVMVSTGIIIWLGIGLLCRNIVKAYLTRWELQLYYILAFISIVFNLIIMKLLSRIEIALIDLCVTGTFLELIVFITLWFYSRREYQKIMARKARRRAQAQQSLQEGAITQR